MTIKRLTWINFFLAACLSVFIWCQFTLPDLGFIKHKISREKALAIAKKDLVKKGINPQQFQTAIIYKFDNDSNQFLQRTLGSRRLIPFIEKEELDLFYWQIRFFKELEKEGHTYEVSSFTGEVVSYQHSIEASAARKVIEREEAKAIAIAFLKDKFSFDISSYEIRGDLQTKRDFRTDYRFSWMKKTAKIPWSENLTDGTGKVMMAATVSGDEILAYAKNYFEIPEQYKRAMATKQNVGNNISTVVYAINLILLVASVYFVAARPNHLAMHLTKKFYLSIAGVCVIFSILSTFNQWQELLHGYPTTSTMREFILRHLFNMLINALMLSVTLVLPSLSGELLRFEVTPQAKQRSFLYYVQTTFFSREVGLLCLLGYCVCIIMLGLQSVIINFGQKYWGVWTAHNWMENLTSAYFPFLAAFIFAFKSSLAEELMYRLFAVNWCQKITNSIFLAILIPAVIWGFNHTAYPVFPMWFRGLEISILGLLMAFVYLKFGIIPVIIGHYLFNAFWHSIGFIIGTHELYYVANTYAVLLLPLLFAMAAIVINKKVVEKPLQWQLNKHQLFNVNVLKTYFQSHPEMFSKPAAEIRQELIKHGWDVAVVETALEEAPKRN